MHLTNQYL